MKDYFLIQKAEDFNRDKYLDYLKAVQDYNPEEAPFPVASSYLFLKRNGDWRDYGYVLTLKIGKKKAYYWRKTKRECVDLLFKLVRDEQLKVNTNKNL